MLSAAPTNIATRDALLSELIVQVTGFQVDSESFLKCRRLAKKQIKVHRWQTTNEHEVIRQYGGLVEKFAVYSQDTKADTLRKSLNSLLSLRPSYHFLIHDMLRLFLSLSEAPLRNIYHPCIGSMDAESSLTWEDITAEEPLTGSHWEDATDEVDSDDGYSSDESTKVCDSAVTLKEPVADRQPRRQKHRNPDLLSNPNESSQKELERRQYWTREKGSYSLFAEDISFDHQDPCSLAPSLASHQQRDPRFFYRPAASTVYTKEVDFVRECLFLLSGFATAVFRSRSDGSFEPVTDVTLKHLSEGALHDLLQWFADRGTAVQRVRSFAESVCQSEQIAYPLTVQAFASGLLSIVRDFDATITKEEKRFQEYARKMPKSGQQEVTSLMALGSRLSGKLDILDDLSLMLEALEIEKNEPYRDNATWTTQILSAQCTSIRHYEHTCQPVKVSVFVELFLRTMKPYMDTIQNWMDTGKLDDPQEEFFVASNPNATGDEWQSRYILRESVTPNFLTHVNAAIYVCGKSLNVIEQLDASQVFPELSRNGESLYEATVASFIEGMGMNRKMKKRNEQQPSSQYPSKSTGTGSEIEQMFPKCFRALISVGIDQMDAEDATIGVQFEQQHLWQSIDECFRGAIRRHVLAQKASVGRHLTSILFRKCELNDHLKSLQAVYFMTAGAVMHPFCLKLFEKVESRELCYEPHALNAAFAECLASNAGTELNHLDARCFDIRLLNVEGRAAKSSSRELLDAINIHYQTPFPLNIIVTPATIAIYNRIARILLAIKYARHCLDTDDWRGRKATGTSNLLLARQRSAVKARLMHFVANLHAFFLSAVIHAESKTFMEGIKSAQGMDDLILMHDTFVCAVRDRCLLNEKASKIWKQMSAPLELSVEYASLCKKYDPSADQTRSSDYLRDVGVQSNERDKQFAKDLKQLARRVEESVNFVKKALEGLASHGVQHLEALAASLA
ncbi:hypothetical protein, variant [Spizellomyces punctatus DAOM BR117]|uniref:Spindle pole body component n=1 Tax=Spizellomyces punctatus (strain DAOM BR117) TaxID=645134 RepID=A0A0L0HJI6_SPIPD|nr:hypothetical protein, variant [Spizellomyces punctatus DAOM BR117]KND01183.1 hypothetical protein, variant [Spizellomyces punctatus DAOM BR117]|eukprot:XP_016609222.1 hypothetical protein, variant [Spizellomyces punctatus DAOM BR117]